MLLIATNSLLMTNTREWPDTLSKMKAKTQSVATTVGRRASLNAQLAEPWGMCVSASQDWRDSTPCSKEQDISATGHMIKKEWMTEERKTWLTWYLSNSDLALTAQKCHMSGRMEVTEWSAESSNTTEKLWDEMGKYSSHKQISRNAFVLWRRQALIILNFSLKEAIISCTVYDRCTQSSGNRAPIWQDAEVMLYSSHTTAGWSKTTARELQYYRGCILI